MGRMIFLYQLYSWNGANLTAYNYYYEYIGSFGLWYGLTATDRSVWNPRCSLASPSATTHSRSETRIGRARQET